ncbi:oxidoreductase [soil metagenome]
MAKARIATAWLDGCSGCHMSFLDMDHFLLQLADKIELVYSPLVDVKEYPADVDVALIEGAVSTDEDEVKIRRIRQRTKTLVSLGDCAVTGNVPTMRNPFGTAGTLARAFQENVDCQPQTPTTHLPVLLERVVPVHEVVHVDLFIPGCPPPSQAIVYAVTELLAGRMPDVSAMTRFGK